MFILNHFFISLFLGFLGFFSVVFSIFPTEFFLCLFRFFLHKKIFPFSYLRIVHFGESVVSGCFFFFFRLLSSRFHFLTIYWYSLLCFFGIFSNIDSFFSAEVQSPSLFCFAKMVISDYLLTYWSLLLCLPWQCILVEGNHNYLLREIRNYKRNGRTSLMRSSRIDLNKSYTAGLNIRLSFFRTYY